jgi:hypothetical protein
MANEVPPQKLARPVAAPVQTNGSAPSSRQPYAPKRKKSYIGSGIVALLILAILAAAGWAAYHFLFQPKSEAAGGAQATTGRGGHHGKGGFGDKIRVVPATAAKGDVGVYLVGLGAVTPTV